MKLKLMGKEDVSYDDQRIVSEVGVAHGGQEVEVSDGLGKWLLDSGRAMPVEAPAAPDPGKALAERPAAAASRTVLSSEVHKPSDKADGAGSVVERTETPRRASGLDNRKAAMGETQKSARAEKPDPKHPNR